MELTDTVLVHTLWQGNVDVHAARCRLQITNPTPTYIYKQHGRINLSREPMYHVDCWCNDGRETGVASRRELNAAGIPLAGISGGNRKLTAK